MIPDFLKRPADRSRPAYELTPEEWQRFKAERNSRWPRPDFAFDFWKEVARARGLDYRTIIGNPDAPRTFTGLPRGHGKPWCWPMPLRCEKPPPTQYAPSIW